MHFFGIFGFSIVLSLLMDILSMITFHVFLLYLISSKLYFSWLNCLISLFRLFRGKRQNVLRHRVDGCDYGSVSLILMIPFFFKFFVDLDQLLMGAVLFTLLTFLFPTVGVFYICILMVYLVSLGMTLLLEIILQFIYDFPFYHLMLRLFMPVKLSESLVFKSIIHRVSSNGEDYPKLMKLYLYLKPSPISFPKLFSPFLRRQIGQLFLYYFCLDSLTAIVSGNVLLPFTKRDR